MNELQADAAIVFIDALAVYCKSHRECECNCRQSAPIFVAMYNFFASHADDVDMLCLQGDAMRFVPSIPPAPTNPSGGRWVQGLSPVQVVKPVIPGEQALPRVEGRAGHHRAVQRDAQQDKRSNLPENRRKVCRRLSHQPVLEELRSGVERRHHNLCEGDHAEHIDVEA